MKLSARRIVARITRNWPLKVGSVIVATFLYAGLVLSLSRQERPDTSAYADPEIVWRLDGHPPHHVGLIVRAPTLERVEELLDAYEPRIARDFMATLPAPTQATS